MPSNLREYMSKNNITNSSKSLERRVLQEERQEKQQMNMHEHNFNKFKKSKNQCIDELTQILEELKRKETELRKIADNHNSHTLKKFNEDYDTISQQIIRQVELHLRDSKERYLKEIKDRRAVELAECKPIRRNIEKLREQITTLREGLYRENEYRQYISKIVLKDYEFQMQNIQGDMNRMRLPNIEVKMDDKNYSAFRGYLDKLIMIKDDIVRSNQSINFSQSQSQHQPTQRFDDLNPHSNRDQIKRNAASKYL